MPLCAERNPPIEEVISQGVIPRFVQFLQRNDLPQLQVRKQFMNLLAVLAFRISLHPPKLVWSCQAPR